MVEAVIVMALVLLPLILVMPLLSKYADVNLTVVEGARYVAWERSVWHDGNNMPDGANHGTLPVKSGATIQNEVRSRFFGETNRVILSRGGRTLPQGDLNPFLHDSEDEPLVQVTQITANSGAGEDTPGIGYAVMRGFTGFLNLIYTPLSWLGGSANFSPNLQGYHRQSDAVSVQLEQPNPYFREMIYAGSGIDDTDDLSDIDLTFSADSALIVDSWSAQGAQHFQNQTGGLVPTSMLNFPLLNTVRDIAATILLEPKLKQPDPGKDDGLCMGCFNTDPFELDDF
jgi:hypothetical protein